MSTKITIPSEHYVGMKSQNGGIPLAFITPNGTDKSSLNRIQTVNSWAQGRDALDATVIENVPLSGFKFTCDIRRAGRFGAGDKWCIEDPRGFELEISSSNLAYILQNCLIENGVILDQCIWARQSGTNVLLSVNSELYAEAVKYTKISSTTESIKNVKKGDEITLQNGTTGIYLGKYHLLKRAYTATKLVTLAPAQHFLKINSAIPTFHTSATIKISSIKSKKEITDIDAELLINNALSDKNCIVDGWRPPLMAFAKKPINYKISLTPVENIYASLNDDSNDNVVVKLKNGQFGVVDQYGDGNDEYSCHLINVDKINDGELTYIYKAVKKSTPWNRGWTDNEKIEVDFSEDDVESAYMIELSGESKLGNKLKKFL